MNVTHVIVINSADKSTGDNTKIKLIKLINLIIE